MSEQSVRLQKYLAVRGVASRRAAEAMIAAGRVEVNGVRIQQMGATVRPGKDLVAVDGRPLANHAEPRITIMLHKPRGYICSRNPRQGRTVFSLLEAIPRRLVCAGRLDKDSEGLLILSNDGELVQELTHPRHGHAKVYRVRVEGHLDENALQRLNGPLDIEGYQTRPATVEVIAWEASQQRGTLRFTLYEGRNRQIRKMCEAVNLRVRRLIRTRIQSLSLGKLPSGHWRELTPRELARLGVSGDGDLRETGLKA